MSRAIDRSIVPKVIGNWCLRRLSCWVGAKEATQAGCEHEIEQRLKDKARPNKGEYGESALCRIINNATFFQWSCLIGHAIMNAIANPERTTRIGGRLEATALGVQLALSGFSASFWNMFPKSMEPIHCHTQQRQDTTRSNLRSTDART